MKDKIKDRAEQWGQHNASNSDPRSAVESSHNLLADHERSHKPDDRTHAHVYISKALLSRDQCSDEVVAAVRTLSSRADVLYIGSDNTVASAIDGVIAAARHLRLPVIASDAGSVEKGAIAAVSVDYRKLGLSTGILAADVLRSSKPVSAFPNILFKGDLLVINPAAAEAIGFPIPHTVRARAQRVIQRVKAAA